MAAQVIGFLAVALQRFGFGSGGAIQATTVLSVALLFVALLGFRQRVSRIRILLFAVLMLLGSISFVASSTASANSFVLLLSTYSIMVVAPSEGDRHGARFMSGVARACTLGAGLGAVQWLLQQSGRGFFDPVRLLPTEVLRTGFNSYYNTASGLASAASYKPNGVIFLEPSFLSLYSAIGLVYIAARLLDDPTTLRWWHYAGIVLLLAGFAASASASGVVVLCAAAIPLAARSGRNWLVSIAAVVTLAVIWRAGVFDAVATKTADIGLGSSTSLRLYLPYELLTPYWLQSPVIGLGPGAASEAITQLSIGGLQASTLMKALVEYGVGGTVVIFVAIGSALMRSRAGWPVISAVVAAWLIPAEALLNSSLVMMIFYGLSTWTTESRTSRPTSLVTGSSRTRVPGR